LNEEAREAGAACDVVYEKNDSPYAAVIRVAEQKGCDLIMMASHGQRGAKGLLLGSETQKVLTHSGIPVRVLRWAWRKGGEFRVFRIRPQKFSAWG
jgi:nucleotide-binding universal stress UspA family protein